MSAVAEQKIEALSTYFEVYLLRVFFVYIDHLLLIFNSGLESRQKHLSSI